MSGILLIMRQPGNVKVVSAELKNKGHACIVATDNDAVTDALNKTPGVELALVDVAGFGESVWAVCEKLQYKNVPFIVLSGKREFGVSSKTLGFGATSILEKPVVKSSLLQLISNITRPDI
jgi:DNA-binding response OmpR family regulator